MNQLESQALLVKGAVAIMLSEEVLFLFGLEAIQKWFFASWDGVLGTWPRDP